MRLDKGAILASMAIIMVASVFAGAGTTAYFSTKKETSTFTMDAAKMKMSIEAGPYTFHNLVPGQEFGPITIKIKNTGTMDIKYLSGDLIIIENPAFADMIEITSWTEYVPGYYSIQNIPKYATQVENMAEPLTLLELAKSYHDGEPAWASGRKRDQFGGWVGTTTDWATGWGYDPVPEGIPAIPLGKTYECKFTFKFSKDASNDLQGAKCSFKITFLGVQELSQVP